MLDRRCSATEEPRRLKRSLGEGNSSTLEVTKMCLNCGCGEYDKRHKPSDITMEDLKTAADGQGMELKQAGANMLESMKAIEREDSSSA